jgi:hypothetical protein
MAPQPFTYQINFSNNLTPLGILRFTNRTGRLAVVLNASYPDEGHITTYKFEGVITPGATKLDAVSSDWETTPTNP